MLFRFWMKKISTSGYYELEDIVKFFHETPFLKEQGGIIVVEKSIIDYSMSQITQIVESNNGKLLGLFVSEANARQNSNYHKNCAWRIK